MRLVLAFLLLLSHGLLNAQSVSQASVSVPQVQVRTKDGTYESCGVRVMSLQAPNVFPITFIDYSIQVTYSQDRISVGTGKFAGGTIPSMAALNQKKFDSFYVADGWLKPQGLVELPVISKATARDDKNAVLVLLDDAATFQFLTDISRGPTNALVGVRGPKQNLVKVLAHTIDLERNERATFASCLSALADRTSRLSDSRKN